MSMLTRLAVGNPRIDYVGGYAVNLSASASSQNIGFSGVLTGGIGSSAAAGDFVIVYFGTGSTVDRNLVVSGYTEVLATEPYVNDSYDVNLVVAWKIMGATPDTAITLTGGTGSSADAGAIVIHVFRGVDQVNSFDVVTPSAALLPNTVLPNPPAITPVTAGAVVVAGGAGAHTRGGTTLVYSSSDLTNFKSTGGTNTTNDVTVGAGYIRWTGGPVDPAAFTFNGTDSTAYSSAAVIVALRPA